MDSQNVHIANVFQGINNGSPLVLLHPQGYHKLARLMGQATNVAIFRRFGLLNMLRLLSLQAELIELQQQFRIQCHIDEISQDPSRQCLSKWFEKLRESEGTDHQEQYILLSNISEKLEKYSKCCCKCRRSCIDSAQTPHSYKSRNFLDSGSRKMIQ
jgi:hypothetical protein